MRRHEWGASAAGKHKKGKLQISLLILPVLFFPLISSLWAQGSFVSDRPAADYAALGDSYSAGQTPYGITTGYSYADFIRDELAAAGILGTYSKKGVSGYTTADVKNQLRHIRGILSDAEIVTLDIGINDILLLQEMEAYRSFPSSLAFEAAEAAALGKIPDIAASISEIIEEIKTVNADSEPRIYVMGYFNAFPDLPALRPLIGRLNEAIQNAAEESGAVYVDTMAVMDAKLRKYLPGDIHPTAEGYRAIGEEFFRFIKRDLSMETFSAPEPSTGRLTESMIAAEASGGLQ